MVVSVEYRLKKTHGTTPFEAIRDAFDAMRFVREHAAEWGGGYGQERLGDRWKEASPAHNLHEGVPPTLILLGDQDDLIPVDTMKRFELNLTRLGVPCRLVIYPGAGHGFFNRRPEDDRFYVETLGEAIRFLEEQIGLSAP